jgi:sugar phosphate isomerase/epimerase
LGEILAGQKLRRDDSMLRIWSNDFRLGINHHLLYPQSFDSADIHSATLPVLLAMEEFEVVDMFLLYKGEAAEQVVEQVLASGKEVIYNCPLMLGDDLNPHSFDATVRGRTLEKLQHQLDRAKQLRAKKVVIASGIDPAPSSRKEQSELFVDYIVQACEYAGPELELLLEPFDRGIGKHLLIGPSIEARAIARQVHARGAMNFGILLDMGHVPIMNETFEHSAGILGPYIKHVHLGSCVMRDPTNPLYGDMHPPWGYPGGENDVEELTRFLRALRASGYLAPGKRPTVTFEMRPYPRMSEAASIEIFLEKLEQAYSALSSK